MTLSILNYVPTIRDAGKYMACRAENPELPDATLEDGWKLEIHCEWNLKILVKLEKSKRHFGMRIVKPNFVDRVV